MTDHPTRRQEILTQLLERYNELTDPMQTRRPGDGTHVPLMPETYTPSVKELERLLIRLRDERHHLWWHINERYLKVTETNAYRCPKCGGITHASHHRHRDRRGKLHDYPGARIIVHHWNHRTNPTKIRTAIEWLATEWNLKSEPMIPTELMVAA